MEYLNDHNPLSSGWIVTGMRLLYRGREKVPIWQGVSWGCAGREFEGKIVEEQEDGTIDFECVQTDSQGKPWVFRFHPLTISRLQEAWPDILEDLKPVATDSALQERLLEEYHQEYREEGPLHLGG
jgi:hypothetical protein